MASGFSRTDVASGFSRMAGAKLFVGEREIGRITSAAFSPDRGHVVALGYVHRDFVEAGTVVAAAWDDARASAVVV